VTRAGAPILEIRRARLEDAAAACDVMRRSITELCLADHANDPTILEAWLANKTPEIVVRWIVRPNHHFFVAYEGNAIRGAGAMTSTGEVTLNYVAPEARFRGVSRALLRTLEETAPALGCARCTLTSTKTARRFYRAAGYVESGPPVRTFGSESYPMVKELDAEALRP
jgi:GNAT superfamily N-acetyltransferase